MVDSFLCIYICFSYKSNKIIFSSNLSTCTKVISYFPSLLFFKSFSKVDYHLKTLGSLFQQWTKRLATNQQNQQKLEFWYHFQMDSNASIFLEYKPQVEHLVLFHFEVAFTSRNYHHSH